MKQALIVASVASMIDQFNMPNIRLLKDMGYEVSVAANFENGSTCSNEKIEKLKENLKELDVNFYQIDFSRNVLNFIGNLKAFNQLKRVAKSIKFDLVHCHSPIGGLITRFVFNKYRKSGTKVIYTAHGFHFFKGASFKNWFIFYPIEKICSYLTDVLITINTEDYALAQKKMKAKQICYIHGIGIDLKKFHSYSEEEILTKRAELNISDNEIMILSVGELSERKNHKIVIEALSKIKNFNFKYFIVGKGKLKSYLEQIISDYNLSDRVRLLDFRTDVSELCSAADFFIFPSLQEGLPVALMEAIACKTVVLCSNIRGNTDLIKAKKYLFNPSNSDDLSSALLEFLEGKTREQFLNENKMQTDTNYENLRKFGLEKVFTENQILYNQIGRGLEKSL